MASRRPRTNHSAKRDVLLDAAWDLFQRHGYHAVGIDAVLAHADVAKMTLYNHFTSKEDLIAAVLERKAADFAASLDSAIDAAGKSPRRRLLAIFDWLADWFRSPDFAGCAFLSAAGEYRSATDSPHAAAVAFKTALEARIEALSSDARLRRPATLARQLMLLIDGATVHAAMHHSASFAEDARAAAKVLIDAAT